MKCESAARQQSEASKVCQTEKTRIVAARLSPRPRWHAGSGKNQKEGPPAKASSCKRPKLVGVGLRWTVSALDRICVERRASGWPVNVKSGEPSWQGLARPHYVTLEHLT